MRILNIRFKNLNSLVGEWAIDLTHPAYLSDGIFAITGPTGAGKTTILDAVCLALYGRTPRLPRISKNENELMSRQKGECFAEVTFEVGAGTFRCHWAQWRARKKADGDLQTPRHELSDALSGRIVESNIRGVAEKVEAFTGMDFDRFTRSMLLAQGGFAAFLQAPPDQRSPILEQLTGTEIYTSISRRVHERLVAERSRLDTLEAELSGIHLLDESEAQRLQTELDSQRAHIRLLEQEAEQTRQGLRWLEGLHTLQATLLELEKARKELEERSEAFEPQRRTLHRATRALELAGEYAGLVSLRKAQEQDTIQARATAEALPACETARREAQKALDAAASQREQARAQREQGVRVIRAVRELDAAMQVKAAALTTLERDGKTRTAALEALRESVRQQAEKLAAARAEQTAVLAELQTTAADQSLAENLSALRQRFEHWAQATAREGEARRTLTQATARQQETCAAHARLLAQQEARQRALSEMEHAVALQKDRLRDSLGMQTSADRHARLVHLVTRLGLLDKAEEETRQWGKSLRTHHNLELRQTALDQTEQACRQRLGQAEEHCRELALLCSRQEARKTRLLALAEARKELREGKPCPLCGAPYAADGHPALECDADDTETPRLRENLRQAENARTAAHGELAGLEREHTWLQEQRQTAAQTLEEHAQHLRDTLSRLNLPSSEVETDILARIQNLRETDAAETQQLEHSLRQAETAEQALQQAQTALDAARRSAEAEEAALQTSAGQRERAEQEAFHAEQTRCALDAQQAALRESLREALAPYGLSGSLADADSILAALTERRDARLNRERRRDILQQTLVELETASRHLAARKLDMEQELSRHEATRRTLTEERDSLRQERHALFGDREPDTEEHRLEALVEEAEKQRDAAQKKLEDAGQRLTALHSQRTTLERALAERLTQLAPLEQDFRLRLTAAGFLDEADYCAAILPEATRTALSLKEQTLLTERAEQQARWNDTTARLHTEREKHLTEQSCEALHETLAQLAETLNSRQERVGGLRRQLDEDQKTRQTHRERAEAAAAQRREYLRWSALHDLIGSADGKKYRNFVQVLTFDLVIEQANRQLRRMTDRYLLLRDKEQPLELDVMDAYQAGEVRSTKNLSGGESFIVSLALALGLSQMASKTVKVDSLFLDEGFGTLDEDTLDTALDTLAGLHRDGKLIGIISHVSTLKERISTQIQVTPGTGGRSRLSGPGCSHGES